MSNIRIPLFAKVFLVLLLLVGVVIWIGWYKLFREEPQQFASIEEYFKYGSVGTEQVEGIPYWIWLVLPRVFPEYVTIPPNDERVAGGYTAFGFIVEEGQPMPVGLTRKVIGFPRVGINCALCHTASYRTSPQEDQKLVLTAPAQTLNSQAYLRFLHNCAKDPRFNADHLLPAIEYNTKLSWLDRLLYRYIIIPQTRAGVLEQAQRYAWTYSRPLWGPGRIDPFNPVKFNPRLLDIDPAEDNTIGNSDMEPLWNMAQHEGFALHWDGLNADLTEVVLVGAAGDGATHESLPVDDLKNLQEKLFKTQQPPPYPFKESLNPALVARGEVIYNELCASCHAFGGERTGKVEPLDEIGTDRHRLDMWTAEAARRYNEWAAGYPWDFDGFVKTNGYVNVALDGLWLRAPYLHNGSVPTLEDLLKPVAERPQVFYRGYDVYLANGTGFIHQGSEAERYGFRFDTREPGNGNGGHEGDDYGTNLSPEDKAALVEYMKTL